MEPSELMYPKMRQELVDTMTSLSDREYQQRVWIDKKYPHENFYDDLTTTVNVFHDLITDDEDFSEYVGAFLVNQEEARAVEQVYRALDVVIDALGDSADDRYLSDPHWADVVNKATLAKSVLTRSG